MSESMNCSWLNCLEDDQRWQCDRLTLETGHEEELFSTLCRVRWVIGYSSKENFLFCCLQTNSVVNIQIWCNLMPPFCVISFHLHIAYLCLLYVYFAVSILYHWLDNIGCRAVLECTMSNLNMKLRCGIVMHFGNITIISFTRFSFGNLYFS